MSEGNKPYRFQPGQSGNLKGRTKGVGNKVTTQLRQFAVDFLDDNKDKIQEDFDSLSAKDRLAFWLGLLQYALPKKNDLEITQPITDVTVEYHDFSEKKNDNNELDREEG